MGWGCCLSQPHTAAALHSALTAQASPGVPSPSCLIIHGLSCSPTCATSASTEVNVLTPYTPTTHFRDFSPVAQETVTTVTILPGFPGRGNKKAALHPLPVIQRCTARVLATHSQETALLPHSPLLINVQSGISLEQVWGAAPAIRRAGELGQPGQGSCRTNDLGSLRLGGMVPKGGLTPAGETANCLLPL